MSDSGRQHPETELEYMKERLERFIDCSSLDSVLEVIETICEEKAEHIAHNWQDPIAEVAWTRAARLIRSIVKKVGV